jgi:hypothetical protein
VEKRGQTASLNPEVLYIRSLELQHSDGVMRASGNAGFALDAIVVIDDNTLVSLLLDNAYWTHFNTIANALADVGIDFDRHPPETSVF